MTKRLELRTSAAKGNLDAMQMLISGAVAHKQITATVTLANRHLEMILWSVQVPAQQASITLICRELVTWNQPCFDTVTIKGKAINGDQPAWAQMIDLTAPPDAANSLNHLAAGGSPLTDSPVDQQTAQSGKRKPSLMQPLLVQRLDQPAWNSIAAGLLLAIVLVSSDQLRFLFHPLITLVHELGHTFFAWLFGYFAIPAFDFIFGGGITFQSSERSPLLLGAIVAGLTYLFYRYRNHVPISRYLLGFAIIYSLCAFTPLHEMLIKSMGHGFELLFAGIFLFRALSGHGSQIPIERPLYGMMGFFMLLNDIRFAWGLMTNADEREIYEAGKGGLLDNDFVILARDYLGVDLSIVVALFLVCCFLTLLIPFLLFRYQPLILKNLGISR